MKIKIFPETGAAYVVTLPESINEAPDAFEATDAWIDANLKNVQFWEWV